MDNRIDPGTAMPGDLVFAHSNHLIGKLIRLGQRIRWKKWDLWNHVAVLDKCNVYGQWTIIQAEGHGVTEGSALSDLSKNGGYAVIPLPSRVNRSDFLQFVRGQVGVQYGYLTIASIAFNLLSPNWVRLDFRRDQTWICSGLVAAGLWYASYPPTIHWPDPFQITPAELDQLLRGI